jgi:CDP-diacylglycerol--glycerol-3-phosphate 3-phosphatidyltransferase
VISIYDLKPRFQALLRPVANAAAQRGITPNQITLLALAVSLLTGFALYLWPQERWPLLLVPVVLFVRMALNALDGMLAREHDMKTPLGVFLNEMGDVFSDAALYLPFVGVSNISPLLIVLIVVLAVASEMTGVVATQIGAQRRYDGPMGKSDRALVFGALGLALGLGVAGGSWLNLVLAVIVLLLLVTIVNRISKALQEIRG